MSMISVDVNNNILISLGGGQIARIGSVVCLIQQPDIKFTISQLGQSWDRRARANRILKVGVLGKDTPLDPQLLSLVLF